MAQPVETANDYRHTHKDLGLIMVNVYEFVFHASSMLKSAKPSSYYRPLRASTWPLTLTLEFDLDLWHWPLHLTLTLISSEKTLKPDVKHDLSQFDLDLWPTTLIYNPNLAKVKVDPHAKNQVRTSNGSNRRAQKYKHTHKQTNGCYQTYYLSCFAVDN